jgi:hypothetical protein
MTARAMRGGAESPCRWRQRHVGSDRLGLSSLRNDAPCCCFCATNLTSTDICDFGVFSSTRCREIGITQLHCAGARGAANLSSGNYAMVGTSAAIVRSDGVLIDLKVWRAVSELARRRSWMPVTEVAPGHETCHAQRRTECSAHFALLRWRPNRSRHASSASGAHTSP